MQRLFWLAGGLLIAAAAIFTVANRAPLALDLWPIPYEIIAPAFLPVLASLVIGWVTGALMGWLQGGPVRREARQGRHRIADLETRLAAAERDLADARAAMAGLQASAPQVKLSLTRRMLQPVLGELNRSALPTATLPQLPVQAPSQGPGKPAVPVPAVTGPAVATNAAPGRNADAGLGVTSSAGT